MYAFSLARISSKLFWIYFSVISYTFATTPSTLRFCLLKPDSILWIKHYPTLVPQTMLINYPCTKFEKFYQMIALPLAPPLIIEFAFATHECNSPIPCWPLPTVLLLVTSVLQIYKSILLLNINTLHLAIIFHEPVIINL